MTEITLSDFPETIQILLTQAIQAGEPLTITQNNQPLAVISPVKKCTRAAFGSAQSTGQIIGDIMEPTSNFVHWDIWDFRAARGLYWNTSFKDKPR